MPARLSPEAAVATVAALAALAVTGVAWAVAAWALVGAARARRPPGTPAAGPPGWPLELWHALGLAALLPLPGMWDHLAAPAVLVFRAALAALVAAGAVALALWERAARRRYTDRAPAVVARARFLTYGPYLRVRRPRELAIAGLVLATSLALPGWWRPLVAAAVFAPSMAVRAHRAERAERRAFGQEFESYRRVVPLFLPWRGTRRGAR